MFALELEGLDEASARLDAYPAALQAALDAKATELAAALADLVKNDKLSGGCVEHALRRAQRIRSSPLSLPMRDGFVASVGSEGDVKYAAIQEYGGKTSAHEILPAKARRLAFVAGEASISRAASTIRAR